MSAPSNSQPERTIGQLVVDATRDISMIVRGEISIAKAEVKADVQKAGVSAGLLAGAALFGLLGLVLLLFAITYAIVAAGLATWLSFLIVAVALFLLAGLLALVGKAALGKVKGKPERAIRSTQDTITAVKPGH